MKNSFAFKKSKIVLLSTALVSICMMGCAKEGALPEHTDVNAAVEESVGIDGESAQDMAINFTTLKEENPDIYGWLYIPNTSIDFPIMQSGESDQYYQTHDSFANENSSGGVYTEMATMRDMCDFNTVLRGSKDILGEADSFFDPEFFSKNENFYIFIEGNKLTYEIVACYSTMGDSPIHEYEFCYAPGCREYIKDIFTTRDMTRQVRADWAGLNETNFLTSLYVDTPTQAGEHTVLVGALIADDAGTINRAVIEEPEDIDISTLLSLMEEAE